MNKRLLIITSHKLNENNGGSNGSKGFIHCFAALFDDCSIIYPDIKETSPFIPTKFKLFPMHDHRCKVRKFFDMYRGVISGLYYCVIDHLKHHHYDVIVIDHTFTGAGLSKHIKATGATLITIHHNVERDYLRDNGTERPIFYRFPFLYFSKKSERECLQNSDVNLTVTQRDAQTFQSWYPHIHLYNWGNFEYLPIVDKTFERKKKGSTFAITGSLCFKQSLQPILDFIQRYWPLLLEVYPTAELLIAGRDPAPLLRKTCDQNEHITIIANPEHIEDVVRRADYYICPICSGSGRKLRIIDGLRQGLPILCHRVSDSGYESLAAQHCLFSYHDEKSFIKALQQMMNAQPSADTVYQTYRESFSLQKGQQRLKDILQQEHIL